MKCDSCGKEVEEAVLPFRTTDCPEAKVSLGKYYDRKPNVNLVITWNFCFECLLDALLKPKRVKGRK